MSRTATKESANERLDGWDAISTYLGWHVRTVIRWEKQKGLPVHRVPGGKRQAVFAYSHEIDRWYHQWEADELVAPATGDPDIQPVAAVLPPMPAAAVGASPARSRAFRGILAATACFAAVAALLAAASAVHPGLQVTGISQMTDDGTEKRGLVTDGTRMFFSEEIGGRYFLSTMNVDGGSVRRIDLPIDNPIPVDISPDGKRLLVLSYEGFEEEQSLWVVPLDGNAPAQIMGIKCHSAAWGWDGKWIAYAAGNTIDVVSPDRARTRQLGSLPGIPLMLRRSADDGHLRFLVHDPAMPNDSLWEVSFDGNFGASQSVARLLQKECCTFLSGGPPATRYFAEWDEAGKARLTYLRPSPWWATTGYESIKLGTPMDGMGEIALLSAANRIFVLGAPKPRSELVRFDRSGQSFTPYFAGASATALDFSRANDLVAYVRSADATLWVSRMDGSAGKQLSPARMGVELPRWSPDSKQIAFMGKEPNRPWRIFIVPSTGGVVKEASHGDDGQGAPTWSPDGKKLAYGNVQCQVQHTCAIHTIDMATGVVETLPRSQGLGTARWSPDGRYIAALDPERRELLVYSLPRQQWRVLATDSNGNDVSWSTDSKFVYTNRTSDKRTEIIRVPATGGEAENVVSLDFLGRLSGHLDTWFCVAPDGSLLSQRWFTASEIYSVSYKGG
ncbi:MAG TPA: hypothetical protein VGD64_16715 [Acidisarcina sp.]